jgi:hypothetical protein
MRGAVCLLSILLILVSALLYAAAALIEHVQEATHNARGMTWAHPFDFFPELSPLPAECAASKPFSVGCLAVGPGSMLSYPGWSEVAQVRWTKMFTNLMELYSKYCG